MSYDYRNFVYFKNVGITPANDIDVLRLKLNGLVKRVSDGENKDEVDAAYLRHVSSVEQIISGETRSSTGVTSFAEGILAWNGEGIYFPTAGGVQDETDQKLKGHTSGVQVLGSALNDGVFYNGKGLFANVILNTSPLRLGNESYELPSTSANSGILSIGADNITVWTSLQAFVNEVIAATPLITTSDVYIPVGTVIPYSGNLALLPYGWIADNQTVSVATWPDLADHITPVSGLMTIPDFAALHAPETGYVYIIKVAKDALNQFNITYTSGIALSDVVNSPISSINLTNLYGKVSISYLSDHFVLASGNLTLKAGGIDTSLIADGSVTNDKMPIGHPIINTSGDMEVPTNLVIGTAAEVSDDVVRKTDFETTHEALRFRVKSMGASPPGVPGLYPITNRTLIVTERGEVLVQSADSLNNNSHLGPVAPNEWKSLPVAPDGVVRGDINCHLIATNLFVQNGDRVYSSGANQYGQCALVIKPTTWGDRSEAGMNRAFTIDPIKSLIYSGDTFEQSYACLTVAGDVYTAGRNNVGQLGIGNIVDTHASASGLPRNIHQLNTSLPKFSKVIKVGGNGRETYVALDVNGRIWGWGENLRYEIGCNTNTPQLSPVMTTSLATTTSNGYAGIGTGWTIALASVGATKIVDIYGGGTAGTTYVFLVDDAGNIWCSGDNSYAQSGIINTPNAFRIATLSLRASVLGKATKVVPTVRVGPTSYVMTQLADGSNKLYVAGLNTNNGLGVGTLSNGIYLAWTGIDMTLPNAEGFTKLLNFWSGSSPLGGLFQELRTYILCQNPTTGKKMLYQFGGIDYYVSSGMNAPINSITPRATRVPFSRADEIKEVAVGHQFNTIILESGEAFYAGYTKSFGMYYSSSVTMNFTPLPFNLF